LATVGTDGAGVLDGLGSVALGRAAVAGSLVPHGLMMATSTPITITAMTFALRPSSGEDGPGTRIMSLIGSAGQSPPR
jgi:hypothetical protein